MFADLAGGLVAGEALGMPDCLDWAPFQHIAGERTWHTQDSHGQILALDFWCSPWARERDLAWLGCAPLVVVGGFQEDRQIGCFRTSHEVWSRGRPWACQTARWLPGSCVSSSTRYLER